MLLKIKILWTALRPALLDPEKGTTSPQNVRNYVPVNSVLHYRKLESKFEFYSFWQKLDRKLFNPKDCACIVEEVPSCVFLGSL
jgi:hypothetical protein